MRTPDQKFGAHLARRLLESYDGSCAPVRGARITVEEADTYIEKLEGIIQSFRDRETRNFVDALVAALDAFIKKGAGG